MDRGAIRVHRVGPDELEAYVAVPMRLVVSQRLVPGSPPYRSPLPVAPVDPSYVKDYAPGTPRAQIAGLTAFRADTTAHVVATADGQAVGGATTLHACPAYALLGGREDLLTLRGLRVHPAWRRRGCARLLLRHVVKWALRASLAEIQVETQDVNVPARHT